MTRRLGYALVCVVVAGTLGLSACSDDDDSTGPDGNAGTAGSSAGSKTGGTSTGGTSSKAGTNSGGTTTAGTNSGGATPGGTGGAEDAGAGGKSDGGAVSNAGAAGNDAGGAGGAGGAGELTYACGSDTLPKKLCSAFVAADCTDPTVCADCVTERTAERDDFYTEESCDACRGKFDAYFQCVVDAFEGGDITSGVECLEDYGADIHFDNCVPLNDEASACHTWLNENPCPSTWPPT